ncbi:MAG: hypothetical protein ABIB97_01795 [Patescibacteria group bacterium]
MNNQKEKKKVSVKTSKKLGISTKVLLGLGVLCAFAIVTVGIISMLAERAR